jgi:hypothetical protein
MKRILLTLLATSFLSACESGTPPLPQGGQYRGFYDHQQVIGVLKQVSDTELQLSISSASDSSGAIEVWDLKIPSADQVILQTPSGETSYSPGQNSNGCYEAKNGDNTLEFCWTANEIHWSEKDPSGKEIAELDLSRLLTDAVPTLETPQGYTLQELTDRAQKRNFDNVVEFQRVVLAKDNALNADLNLAPHGNAADALNILSGNMYTEMKSVGDLAPFLLPSHWFRAFGTNDLLASEKEAWTIMDLDGVNFVESYTYESARDEAALSAMASERTTIAALRDFIRGKETHGLAPIGLSDDLSSLINKIDQSTNDLQTIQSNELGALSEAAGFYNPEAVTNVTLPQSDPSSPSAGNPLKLDFATTAEIAVSKSAELRQLNDMVEWAKMNRDARYFDWMDPSGDSDGGIGLGLPTYIQAGQAQVDEIVAQESALKATLLKQLSVTISELQKTADDYTLAVQGGDIQYRRVLRLTESLKVGDAGFVMSDLIGALQDQLNSQLGQIDAEYGYLLALSRLNRILYQGVYSPQENGDSTWSGLH